MKRPQNPKAIKEELNFELEDNDNHCSTPMKSIKLEEQLRCELCSMICSSISQLQSHTLSEHVPDRKPSISSAPLSPPTQRVACQQCEETFENFAQFAVHMKSHIGGGIAASTTTSPAQIFFCPVCPVGAPFRDKKSQLEHLTTQHLQIQVHQIVCAECDSIFASVSALTTHFAEAHRKLKCASCDFVADSEKAFKEHSKVHSRQVTVYGCALCGTSYNSQSSLVTHVQLAHDQDNFYIPRLPTPHLPSPSTTNHQQNKPKPPRLRVLSCSVCDEQVLGEDALDEHRLRKHCKVRHADKCADCQEQLLDEPTFVEHCLRHAKDHAHHCPVCRQSLRSDAQIHTHSTYHMNRKTPPEEDATSPTSPPANGFSFVCPICGEKLDDAFALIEHTKRHL